MWGGVTEPATDEILMAAYQAGSEAAFAELFERHAGAIYGFLVRRLGDPALAEDLYQEVFLRLHRARPSYDLTRPFRTWLFSIAHNLLKDTLRSRRRTPGQAQLREDIGGTAESWAETTNAADPGAVIASDGASPEAAAATRELGQALNRALGALPQDEATVLILARLEGLAYDEIGHVIGRSAAATKQLAYRALKRVRAELVAGGHGGQT